MGDYMVIDAIAGRTGEATGDLVVPTLSFGYSEYFRMYPGTLTLQPATLTAVVEDLIECLRATRPEADSDLQRASWQPADPGTADPRSCGAKAASSSLRSRPLHFMLHPEIVEEVYGKDVTLGHGGEPMGSVMMVLAPGKVRMENAGAYGRTPAFGMPSEGLGTLNVNGIRVAMPLDMTDVTPDTGSLGDPSLATEERGKRLLDYAVERTTEFMRWFKATRSHGWLAPRSAHIGTKPRRTRRRSG